LKYVIIVGVALKRKEVREMRMMLLDFIIGVVTGGLLTGIATAILVIMGHHFHTPSAKDVVLGGVVCGIFGILAWGPMLREIIKELKG
jgi:hypothetical protein